jgi:hypothetical protein
MISMCGNCSAKVLSVMDGQRPQIRCEGRWRAPYIGHGTALIQRRYIYLVCLTCLFNYFYFFH